MGRVDDRLGDGWEDKFAKGKDIIYVFQVSLLYL